MVDVEDPDETQEQRAMRALQNILNGANVTDESMKLSNEYTDRQTAKLSAWFRSIIRRRK
jgi:hypothetical protein